MKTRNSRSLYLGGVDYAEISGSIMTIEPSAFWAGVGALVAAVAFAIRQWSLTRDKTEGNRSTGQLAIENAQAEGLKTLNIIAAQSLAVQQDLRNVIIENGKAFNDSASQMRGMLLMFDGQNKTLEGHGKILRESALVVDDLSVQMTGITKIASTLQTDIGENFSTQIGPVVVAIQSIGAQLDTLNQTLQSKDETTIKLMGQLQFAFGALETTLLKMLEPIALKAIGDIRNEHAENGSVSAPHPAAE